MYCLADLKKILKYNSIIQIITKDDRKIRCSYCFVDKDISKIISINCIRYERNGEVILSFRLEVNYYDFVRNNAIILC